MIGYANFYFKATLVNKDIGVCEFNMDFKNPLTEELIFDLRDIMKKEYEDMYGSLSDFEFIKKEEYDLISELSETEKDINFDKEHNFICVNDREYIMSEL